jgi:5-methylcytosine-specific restriction endonuclease McrA
MVGPRHPHVWRGNADGDSPTGVERDVAVAGTDKEGHTVEVRLPDEIGALRRATRLSREKAARLDVEKADFLGTRVLRKAIHARERGICIYCLKRLNDRMRALDHVLAQSRGGGNSYRNLVSCCLECNSAKGEKSAADLLRSLYRERRLTAVEVAARLRTLKSLAAGKLRPVFPK